MFLGVAKLLLVPFCLVVLVLFSAFAILRHLVTEPTATPSNYPHLRALLPQSLWMGISAFVYTNLKFAVEDSSAYQSSGIAIQTSHFKNETEY